VIATKPHRNGLANGAAAQPKLVRVAAYTRKSTEEGLDQKFNTLDAQREAIAAFVNSQEENGWRLLADRFDDGGYSGANLNRPALKRLLVDVEAGKVDVLATYRLDRLSRNQFELLGLIDSLAKRGVAYMSVVERFDTSTPMGRFGLQMMGAVAELERAQVSERTRDKIRATRRKGMWTGGHPPLGYDVVEKRLVVNPNEAARVRATFELFIAQGALGATVEELCRRGWRQKSWVTRAKTEHVGGPFTKSILQALLTNPVYVGKLRAGDELVDAQHPAIVEPGLWDAVQARLKQRATGLMPYRSRIGALLSGLVHCGRCRSSMHANYSQKRGRRTTYYVCAKIQKQGAAACPGSRVSAAKLEAFVVDQIRAIGRDPALVRASFEALHADHVARKAELELALAPLAESRKRLTKARRNLQDAIAASGPQPGLTDKLAEVERGLAEAVEAAERHRAELALLEADAIDEADFRQALTDFTELWAELFPAERARVLRLLIAKVTVDAPAGDVRLDLRPSGVKVLANEQKEPVE